MTQVVSNLSAEGYRGVPRGTEGHKGVAEG